MNIISRLVERFQTLMTEDDNYKLPVRFKQSANPNKKLLLSRIQSANVFI